MKRQAAGRDAEGVDLDKVVDGEGGVQQYPPGPNDPFFCPSCEQYDSLCHYKMFGGYCSEAADFAFRSNPPDTTRKSCVLAFSEAYNRCLDFRMFQLDSRLMPKTFYLFPSYYHT